MKFFHLSDLHIGKQLHFYSLREDQQAVLGEIAAYAEKLRPQAIVIAGDIYDKSAPSAEAVALFDAFLRKLSDTGAEILVISGNHDSPERLEFASSLLEKQHLHIAGLPPAVPEDHIRQVALQDEYGEVRFWLLPFLKPAYVRGVFDDERELSYTESVKKLIEREEMDTGVRNILVTHQFFTAAGYEPSRSESETVYVGGVGNVDVSAVDGFDYVAMGHIHKGQQAGGEKFRYCGTPLKYSAGEAGDRKTLTVVTLKEKGAKPVIEELELHPLHDVRRLKGPLEDLLRQGCDDYVSLTLTDERLPYQPRERLDQVFPNILEIKVENERTRRQMEEDRESVLLSDPLELFAHFYQEIHGRSMDDEETRIIREILEEAGEETE